MNRGKDINEILINLIKIGVIVIVGYIIIKILLSVI